MSLRFFFHIHSLRMILGLANGGLQLQDVNMRLKLLSRVMFTNQKVMTHKLMTLICKQQHSHNWKHSPLALWRSCVAIHGVTDFKQRKQPPDAANDLRGSCVYISRRYVLNCIDAKAKQRAMKIIYIYIHHGIPQGCSGLLMYTVYRLHEIDNHITYIYKALYVL